MTGFVSRFLVLSEWAFHQQFVVIASVLATHLNKSWTFKSVTMTKLMRKYCQMRVEMRETRKSVLKFTWILNRFPTDR